MTTCIRLKIEFLPLQTYIKCTLCWNKFLATKLAPHIVERHPESAINTFVVDKLKTPTGVKFIEALKNKQFAQDLAKEILNSRNDYEATAAFDKAFKPLLEMDLNGITNDLADEPAMTKLQNGKIF